MLTNHPMDVWKPIRPVALACDQIASSAFNGIVLHLLFAMLASNRKLGQNIRSQKYP